MIIITFLHIFIIYSTNFPYICANLLVQFILTNPRHTPLLKSIISFHSCSTANSLIPVHIPHLLLKSNSLHFPIVVSILPKIHYIFLVIRRELASSSLQFHHNVSPFSFIPLVHLQLKSIKAINLLLAFLDHSLLLISAHISLNKKIMASLHSLINF